MTAALTGRHPDNLLDLSHLRMRRILPRSFVGIDGGDCITELALNNNLLEVVPTATFEGLGGLAKLALQYNKIRQIEEGAFRGLTHLTKLELAENLLTAIRREWLEDLRSLSHLDLDRNRLHLIGPYVFGRPRPITEFTAILLKGRQSSLLKCPTYKQETCDGSIAAATSKGVSAECTCARTTMRGNSAVPVFRVANNDMSRMNSGIGCYTKEEIRLRYHTLGLAKDWHGGANHSAMLDLNQAVYTIGRTQKLSIGIDGGSDGNNAQMSIPEPYRWLGLASAETAQSSTTKGKASLVVDGDPHFGYVPGHTTVSGSCTYSAFHVDSPWWKVVLPGNQVYRVAELKLSVPHRLHVADTNPSRWNFEISGKTCAAGVPMENGITDKKIPCRYRECAQYIQLPPLCAEVTTHPISHCARTKWLPLSARKVCVQNYVSSF